MNKSRYTNFPLAKEKQKQLYFSSSEQQDAILKADRRGPPDPTNGRQEESLNQLSGLQIFEIFCDLKQVRNYLSQENLVKGITIRFLWRIHYIIGELVIQVQQSLVNQNKLYDCLLLQDAQIDTIAQTIIKRVKQNKNDAQLPKILNLMLSIYKGTLYDDRFLHSLYKYFVNMSYKQLKFEMVLNFDSKPNGLSMIDERAHISKAPVKFDQQVKKKKQDQAKATQKRNFAVSSVQNPRIGNYSVIRMPPEKDYSPLKMSLAAGKSYEQPSGQKGAINGKQATEPQPTQASEKGYNSKWSATEQGIFCKIYSQHDSPVVCAQLMEEKVGPDGRWRNPNQIEVKMYSLVEKVFKKFSTLSTNNEYIKKFREHKDLVLNMTDQVIKKKIFRNIAIIYESMLNVSEQKKAVISHKILEVNRLCKQATYMKK